MSLDIEPIKLINAVKKRSSLYDNSKKEYKDRKLKKILWKEVCQEVYSSTVWNSLSTQDKNRYGREAQKRWCSLRHCFRRELVTQKTARPGNSGVKKRKYMYFDSLSFLLPFTETVKTGGLIDIDVTNISQPENGSDTTIQNDFKAEPSSSEPRTPKRHNDDEEMVTFLQEGNPIHCNPITYDNEQDDDDLFFRSLIPYMKEFQGNRKLLLRMEIMKLILNFRSSSNNRET